MAEFSENNKRIAKNTAFLYIRMLLIMLVSLYTVRVVLKALGAEDYGINNVVGGVVTMFSFLTGTMVNASQRFFSYELGKKNLTRLNQYFNISIWCYFAIAIFVLIVAETLGLWFLKNKMIIPIDRMDAAYWVYQCSVISFILNMVMIPYTSIIIAKEQMYIYAYISIAEVFLKLLIIYFLLLFSWDNLKLYAVLLCVLSFFVTMIYVLYCCRKVKEIKLAWYWDTLMFRELMSYCGWNLFGALSAVFRNQCINILLNMFFNPLVNAARAIAFQIGSAVDQLVVNFFKAVQPQITKYYAEENYKHMTNLVFCSSRFCYYLVFFMALPILIETSFILKLWLYEYPKYTVLFTQLIVVTTLVESISYPLMAAIQSTGKIKMYQIVTGGLLLLNLPLSYYFLKGGYLPSSVMIIAIILCVCSQISRLYFMRILLNMSIIEYLRNVVSRIAAVTILSSIAPLLIIGYFPEGVIRFLFVFAASSISMLFFVYSIGITEGERCIVNKIIHVKTGAFCK